MFRPVAMPHKFRKTSRLALSWLAVWLASLNVAADAHAFSFGHARLLSATGAALRADIAVVQLRAQEPDSLQASVAPEAAWRQAGLTPPVDLSSLRIQLLPGRAEDARIVRLSSDQAFTGVVADFLIDVQTVMGVQRHQVSVLAQRQMLTLPDDATVAAPEANRPGAVIPVQRGDTLFGIVQRHAVSGFSVYQMMAALFSANPAAFIDGNMNLVRAGAGLQRPDAATLSRLTDRQARQLFVAHARAYALRRARGEAAVAVATQDASGSMQPIVQAPSERANTQAAATRAQLEPPQDQLRLSAADVDSAAATRTGADAAVADGQAAGRADALDALTNDPDAADPAAARGAVRDAQGRIAQLEDNVRELNQVLQELEQVGAGAATRAQTSETAAAPGQASHANGGAASLPSGQAAQPLASSDLEIAQGDVAASAASATEQANAQTAMTTSSRATPVLQDAVKQGDPQSASDAVTAVTPGLVSASPGASTSAAVSASDARSVDGSAVALPAVPAVRQANQQMTQAQAQAQAQATQTARTTTPQDTGSPNTMWVLIVAGLVLLTMLVVWLLRRTRADAGDDGKITDAMIQEKLNAIDLNLDREDPSDDPSDDLKPTQDDSPHQSRDAS